MNDYREVAALPVDEQRALLRAGDPAEQIWAAWALGLRLGHHAAPELTAGLAHAPDPGTRRHLAVMLAGLGERTVLATLAQADPDSYVRATACQYLFYIAPTGDQRIATLLSARLLDDQAIEVRQMILRLLLEEGLVVPIDALAVITSDDDPTTRRMAIDALLRTTPAEQLFPGVLEQRIVQEPDPSLRHVLIARCFEARGSMYLVTSAHRLPDAMQTDVLELLVRHRQHVPWSVLEPLTIVNEPTRDALALKLIPTTDAPQAFDWLLTCAARGTTLPEPRNLQESARNGVLATAANDAMDLLTVAVPQIGDRHLTDEQRTKLEAIVTRLDVYQQEVAWQRELYEEEGEDGEEEIAWLDGEDVQRRLHLLPELRRLLASSGLIDER